MTDKLYKYQFEKSPKKKGQCPSCRERDVWRYYEDENGERLEPQYGKCERKNSCKHFCSPYDNNLNMTPSNSIGIEPNKKVETIYPSEEQCEEYENSIKDATSNFHQYCISKGLNKEHLAKHGVGTDLKGNTIFIFKDVSKKIVNAKTVRYSKDGKREKGFRIYSLKQPKDTSKKYKLCCFGEDLMDKTNSRTVIVVESEKSKVIASFFYPEYDWIACGSANGLTEHKIKILKDKNVIWLCDADKAGRENSSLKNLDKYGVDFDVIDLFPSKNDGYDIADIILEGEKIDLKQIIDSDEKQIDYVLIGKRVKFHRIKCSMSVKSRNGWVNVADNFQIYIEYQTKDEQENISWILKIKVRGSETIYLEVEHEDFCSAKRLKNILATKHMAYKAQENQHTEIQNILFTKTDYGRAKKMNRFGFDVKSNAYFFSNKVLINNLELVEPDEFGIINSKDCYLSMPNTNNKLDKRFLLSGFGIRFNNWFQIYQKAHLYEFAIIPACFYIMSLFRDVVVKHKNTSPILFLQGSAGTGKSSIVRSLTCLFGFQQDDINLKSKNTEAAIVKLMSQASNVLLWMDEFHNDFPHEGLLQASYDNTGYHRTPETSKSKSDTESIDIHSALALTSNYLPKNPIFFSRCLLVQIEQSDKNVIQRKAFKELNDLEKHGLGAITVELLQYRELICENYLETFKDFEKVLTSKFDGESISERLFTNVCQTFTCAIILQANGKIEICESTEYQDILESFSQIASKFIVHQNQIQSDTSVLNEFIGILQMLYDSNQIHEGVHFRIDKDLLLLRMPSIYPIFVQKYRQSHHKSAPDKDSIIQEIVKLEKGRSMDEILKTIRFKKELANEATPLNYSASNSISITYELCVQRFGLDLHNRNSTR